MCAKVLLCCVLPCCFTSVLLLSFANCILQCGVQPIAIVNDVLVAVQPRPPLDPTHPYTHRCLHSTGCERCSWSGSGPELGPKHFRLFAAPPNPVTPHPRVTPPMLSYIIAGGVRWVRHSVSEHACIVRFHSETAVNDFAIVVATQPTPSHHTLHEHPHQRCMPVWLTTPTTHNAHNAKNP
jgi:hypothetical protein